MCAADAILPLLGPQRSGEGTGAHSKQPAAARRLPVLAIMGRLGSPGMIGRGAGHPREGNTVGTAALRGLIWRRGGCREGGLQVGRAAAVTGVQAHTQVALRTPC